MRSSSSAQAGPSASKAKANPRSRSSPTPSAADRQQRERTRNAESQAALRARRRAHVEALEARLPQLESQLQTALAEKAELEARLARTEEQLTAWRSTASPASANLESAIVAERRRTTRLAQGLAAVRAAVDEVLRGQQEDLTDVASTPTAVRLASPSTSAAASSPGRPTTTSLPSKRRRTEEHSFVTGDLAALPAPSAWLDGPLISPPPPASTPSASSSSSTSSSLSVHTPTSPDLALSDDFARRLLAHSAAEMDQDLRRARAASEASRKLERMDQAVATQTIVPPSPLWDASLLSQSQVARPSPNPSDAQPSPSTAELYGLLSAVLARCNSKPPTTTTVPTSPQDWTQQVMALSQAQVDGRSKSEQQQLALFL